MSSADAVRAPVLSSPIFVCAWCGDPMGLGASRDRAPTNFGICPECLKTQLSRLAPRQPARRVAGPGGSPLTELRAAR